VFDGIDCEIVKPNPVATFGLGTESASLCAKDEVITFVNRNLEPHRGFHVFMRALPEIQRLRPNAHVVIVGGDGASYSRPSTNGTYRQHYSKEIDGRVNWDRIHFVGRIPYARYLSLLQVSTVHVYLSYPFVLSWSLMEALAASCLVIASKTPAIEEVIADGYNGLLVDFFDHAHLALQIDAACRSPSSFGAIRDRARRRIVDDYELHNVCPPQFKQLLLSRIAGKTQPVIGYGPSRSHPLANRRFYFCNGDSFNSNYGQRHAERSSFTLRPSTRLGWTRSA
jgi:glycosyltransferase involved in cell wall biosynthesis